MSTRTLSAPTSGPLTVEIAADQLELEVIVEPGRTRAELELSGPETTLDATTSSMNGCWRIELPASEPTVAAGGGSIQVGGSNVGSISVSGGVVAVGGSTTVINGNVVGGNVRVNGVTITGDAVEPVRATLRLPQECGLRTDITNGQVGVRGHLAEVDHRGHNVGLDLDSVVDVEVDVHNGTIALGRVAGSAEVSTHNGAIRVGSTGRRTNARTHNGPVTITAGSDGPISARTHNGPITVYRHGHDPRVRTRTHNGTETVC